MVRSVGIDPGEFAVKVVELDGSYRKTRLTRMHVATVSPGDPAQRAAQVAAAVREAVEQGQKGEPTLGHPCREAVLRVLDLPFKGTDQIRKVVKAEVEGEIHGQPVDEMVVDFHEIGAGVAGGTRVLVASVPKAGLKLQLDALAGVAIEPEAVDLDTMALWRAAHWAGAFEPADDAPVPAGTSVVTCVVDVGSRSVKVLLVEGDNLVDMRAIRLGEASIADAVAAQVGIDPARAHEAVMECLRTGSDVEVELAADLPAAVAVADGADGESLEPVPNQVAEARRVVVPHEAAEAAHTQFLQRLARELVRYLASSSKAGAIRALWVTGGGSRAPGVVEMLAEVFGVEARELDVLAHLQHELDPEEAAALGPRLATAVGLALGRLGGPEGFQLRQEELMLQRGFERIKFPLAIVCMVGLLVLLLHYHTLSTQLRTLEFQIGRTHVDPKQPNAAPQFHGMLHSVLAGKWFENGAQFRIEETKGKDYTYKDLVADLVKTDVHKRLQLVRDKLFQVADTKQKESGIYEDVSLESGLAVLVRFAQIMKQVEPQLGRYLLLKLNLNMKAPGRKLTFTIAFRGPDFRDREGALREALDREFAQPDSPFEKPASRDEGTKEEPFKAGDGEQVPGAYYNVTLRVKDSFVPFGPSAPVAGR